MASGVYCVCGLSFASCIRICFPPPPPPTLVNFPLSTGTVPPWLPFAPESALHWQLIQGGLPAALSPFELGLGGGINAEYVARARLADGSLRIGRVSRSAAFKHGCHIACEYAIQALSWVARIAADPPSCALQTLRKSLSLIPTRFFSDQRRAMTCASCHGSPGSRRRLAPSLLGSPPAATLCWLPQQRLVLVERSASTQAMHPCVRDSSSSH